MRSGALNAGKIRLGEYQNVGNIFETTTACHRLRIGNQMANLLSSLATSRALINISDQ